MNVTEKHVYEAKKAILEKMAFIVDATFAELLEKVKANADFLQEMNDTNGEYKVAFIADAAEDAPQLPNMDGIEPLPTEQKPLVEKVVEVLEMEKTDETPIIDDATYQGLCKMVITGHVAKGFEGKDVTANWVSNYAIKKGVKITSKYEEHLQQLRGIRSEMLRKEMDLQTAKSQHGVEPFEFAALEELAKKHNLK